MVVKLWYVKRGDFVKELELPEETEFKQRFSLVRYERNMHDDSLKAVRWVFVRVTETEYEYSHKESVNG